MRLSAMRMCLKGYLFEANMHGLIVNGKVVGVFISQLGGITVYVQDTDVSLWQE